MEINFENLQQQVQKFGVQRAQRVYDWSKVEAYIREREFVTQREVQKQAGTKYPGIANQWLQRHTALIVNIATREKATTDHPEEFLVKVVQGRNCVYMHKDRFDKLQ